jgi:hypothetical protein
MLTVILCTALATSSVWFIITAIMVSSVSERYKVVVKKRAGDTVSFKTSTGIVKTGTLSVDWMPDDRYVIVEGIKQNYVPYVVRAENIVN